MTCNDIATLCPAYLSGEMDAPSSGEFAEHLRTCRECAGEVERQVALDSLLRRSIVSQEVDTAALDQRVRAQISSEKHSFSARWLAVAAGVVAMLLAGGLAYRTMFGPRAPRLCVDAARDHWVEVTRREHRRWLSDPNAIADLAQHSGISASLIPRLAPAGYRFEHGKLCRLTGQVFLHLVYAQDGNEISVYLRPLDKQAFSGAGLHEADSGREHIAYFQTSQLTAMFVTDQSSAAALSLARSARRVL